MPPIARTGPPTTADMRLWTVALSEVPPPAWVDLFPQPREFGGNTSWHDVQFIGASIAFLVGKRDRVSEWLAVIDRCIAATNTRYASPPAEARPPGGVRPFLGMLVKLVTGIPAGAA